MERRAALGMIVLAQGPSPFHRLCTSDTLSLVFWLFPVNSRSFSCALHSDDSSWQLSHEKLILRHEHFNQSHSQVLYHQLRFGNSATAPFGLILC